jgi:hypothetical protein
MDIVDRLRNGCTCNFESTPCGAEEECQNAFDGADEIVKLRKALRKICLIPGSNIKTYIIAEDALKEKE